MKSIWKGRKYLKLEHCYDPWYTTKGGRDRCLKHYFTLWGWCLALRIEKSGYQEEILDKAEQMFGSVSPILTHLYDRVDKFEDSLHKGLHPEYLTLYCYNDKGALLGSIDDLAWMFKNDCVADPTLKGVAYCLPEKGHIGYSHRAKQLFLIGDKLFDAKYEPKEEDYEEREWAGFVQDQKKAQDRDDKQGWRSEVLLKEVIPYTKRGTIVIQTLEEARTAALNFAKDVS